MAANVSVSGMPRTMGGLKESMKAFRDHHKEVGGALLNISGVGTVDGMPADKDEPRPDYVRQPFPKMVYHAEYGEMIVEDQAELDEALRQKYRTEPYIKPQVAMADPKAEKVALQKELKEKDGQLASLADLLQKTMARLDAIEQVADAPKGKSK